MKIQIKARLTAAVLFECEISADIPERHRVRKALQEAVKAGANLRGANLTDANLRDANLRCANLTGANLRCANLRCANLRGANLTDADLRGADLTGANLRGADLTDADLRGADLTGANLRGADLRGANLTGANLRDANLRGADLTGANLRCANLTGADLRGADLTGANLRGANLTDANLTGAIYDILPATPDQAIANLDKVREIILENDRRLNMDVWHEQDDWQNRTCAEEAVCGTTHCLAGWLQVCSTDEKIRKLPNAEMAGALAAPIARRMFYADHRETLYWLRDRKYAEGV